MPVTQVCAACHSVYQLHFRDLVGVAYTEDEAKAMATEIEVMDGPNDEGETYERPGRLSDPLPRRVLDNSRHRPIRSAAAHVTALVGAGASGFGAMYFLSSVRTSSMSEHRSQCAQRRSSTLAPKVSEAVLCRQGPLSAQDDSACTITSTRYLWDQHYGHWRPSSSTCHRPYANEEAARYANGGAYPPDLSLITKASSRLSLSLVASKLLHIYWTHR